MYHMKLLSAKYNDYSFFRNGNFINICY
ncbi:hypothetical protein ZEAMMB73_Zm00001d026459 [Zea mays]|uniref:Uncharacterized protein n=1 Tax=Zea mays TaxID=4577 RepID=A0A1D6JG21_MAIZE|nr:hypothetical protein ZEAMMB73_Zm00001d026459 [Zea mays]